MSANAKLYAYIDGVRDRSLESLSVPQWRMLFSAQEFGGTAPYDVYRLSTRRSLHLAGLFSGWTLTEMGRRALTVEWRDPEEPA